LRRAYNLAAICYLNGSLQRLLAVRCTLFSHSIIEVQEAAQTPGTAVVAVDGRESLF